MSEKKEFSKWWFLILLLTIISVVVFTVFNYAGVYTSTVVERKVYEQSYQKQAGDSKRMATYQAQLAQINTRLMGELPEQTKRELEAQKAMLMVQINSGR